MPVKININLESVHQTMTLEDRSENPISMIGNVDISCSSTTEFNVLSSNSDSIANVYMNEKPAVKPIPSNSKKNQTNNFQLIFN